MFDMRWSTRRTACTSNLARVGKGWVLLDLGRYADAAAAVADAPMMFTQM